MFLLSESPTTGQLLAPCDPRPLLGRAAERSPRPRPRPRRPCGRHLPCYPLRGCSPAPHCPACVPHTGRPGPGVCRAHSFSPPGPAQRPPGSHPVPSLHFTCSSPPGGRSREQGLCWEHSQRRCPGSVLLDEGTDLQHDTFVLNGGKARGHRPCVCGAGLGGGSHTHRSQTHFAQR